MSGQSSLVNSYYNLKNVAEGVGAGRHREIIGGMWEEIGQLQFALMLEGGMTPEHKLIDIGCGSLRGGVHFVRHLNAGNYYGLDLSQSLLDSGYEKELDDESRKKLPRENLKSGGDFEFSNFGTKFDRAIALSVFTHLPLNHIRICLERLADSMNPGGKFLASFFEIPENALTWKKQKHHPGDITTNGDADPYHYKVSDFHHLTSALPWKVDYIGDVNHPRAQKMMVFERE